MSEEKVERFQITERRYKGLSSSSSSTTTTTTSDATVKKIKAVESFHSDSYHNFHPQADVEPAKEVVRKSILTTDDKALPDIRSDVMRQYRRASSIKEVSRQSKDVKTFIRQSVGGHKYEETVWQQKSNDAESISGKPEDDHDNIKCLAVKKVGLQLLSGVGMLANEHRCPNEPFANMEMPHNFFSWSLDECLARFQHSMVWYNLLQKQLSPTCLETRKISTDFGELKRLINMILEGYLLNGITMSDVLMELNLSDDYINLESTLTKELERNSETYTTQLYQKIAFTFIRRVTEAQSGSSEDKSSDDGILYPIVLRYLIKYQTSVEDQHQIQADIKEECLEENVRKVLKLCENEEYCSQSTMNYYYNENATLRQKLALFAEKYEKDFERVQAQNVYYKLSAKTLVTRKAYFEEQIERFHEEIIEIRAAEVAEEEALLAAQRAEVEAEANRLYELKMEKRRKRLEKIRNKKMLQNQLISKSKAKKETQNETQVET